MPSSRKRLDDALKDYRGREIKSPEASALWSSMITGAPQTSAAPAPPSLPESDSPLKSDSLSDSSGLACQTNSPPESDRLSDSGRLIVRGPHTRFVNEVLDTLLPTLPPAAQIVYMQLYRLTYGHGRDSCRIGHPRLAERCGMGQSTVRTALAQLEKRGAIERVAYRFGGHEQGSVYRVCLPPETPANAVGLSEPGRLSESDSLLKSNSMKDSRKKSMKGARVAAAPAPVSTSDRKKSPDELRALLRAVVGEARKDQPGITGPELTNHVRAWVADQGHEVTDEMIGEAIGGEVR